MEHQGQPAEPAAVGSGDHGLVGREAELEGNPLFLTELAQLLRTRSAVALPDAPLPAGVREVIRQRLARVSPETHALLEVAAVCGDEVEPERVAQAAACERTEVERAFSEAVRAGVLVAHERGRVRFSHALVREVLERDLPEARLRALHGAIAAASLRAAHEDPAGEPPYAELAHHGLCGPRAGLAAAVGHAVLAARRALSLFAFEEAIALLERARAAVAADDAGRALACDVLIALGEAQIRRGAGALGQASCLQAIELARGLGDSERFARAALTCALEITAALVKPELVALLQEALAQLPAADSPLRVLVSARLAAAMQPHHDLQIPIELANEAIAAARRIGDPTTLLEALYHGMAAMMDIVDPRARLPLNLELEERARAAGDREKLLRSQARLVFDHMELCDFASADARIDAFERIAQQSGARRYLWRVPLLRSMRALVHGRFAEAGERCEQAQAMAQAAGDPQLERCSVFHKEGILRASEQHEAMIAFDPEARRMRAALYSGPHWQNGGSAFTYARAEAVEQARMYLELVPQDDWPLVQNPPAFMHLGEPLALMGRESAVQRVYDQLLPAEHRGISWGWTSFTWDGPASRVLGLLALRLGRFETAEAHFAHALALLERLQALPYLARTRYELGRALLARGGVADIERARRLLEQARAGAEQLGMGGLVRLAEQRLAAVPAGRSGALDTNAAAPAAGGGHTPGLAFSCTREGEYWTLCHADARVRLRDSLGLQYLARLLSEPDREIHVLELASGRAAGADDGARAVLPDRGDAGELLDETAVRRYRARLDDLREQLREAEAFGDGERAARAQQEIEFLTAELARAVGLGGRARRTGGASERARSAVQRRIRNALERVREANPELADLLTRAVKTGTFCVFRSQHAQR